MQLAERKILDPEQPIKKYLSGFPFPAEIAIQQLLSHSAGIPNPIPLSWIHLASEHQSFDRDSFFSSVYTRNNKTNDNRPTGMCLSWFCGQLNGNKYFEHAGGGGGYYCEIRIYRDLGIGSMVFFNRTGMSDERFLDKVDKIYFENQFDN